MQLCQIDGILWSHLIRWESVQKQHCQVHDLIHPSRDSAKKWKINMKRERERERYPGDSVNKPSVTQESLIIIINHEKTKLAIMRALILLSLISVGIWQSVLTAGRLGSGWKYFWSELFTPQEPVHTLRENCVAQTWHSHDSITCAERALPCRVWTSQSPCAGGWNGECTE